MTTPNLDKLAALAPFAVYQQWEDQWFLGDDGTPVMLDEALPALNEWAELRATVAELRNWRSEHDCRYTLGAVADIDGIHCPIDNPCVRCQRRMEWDAAQKELTEMRAYSERTEESLRRISDFWLRKEALAGIHSLRSFGLWRDPAPKESTDGK